MFVISCLFYVIFALRQTIFSGHWETYCALRFNVCMQSHSSMHWPFSHAVNLMLLHDVPPDQGELFVWGKNVRGCLGIGKRDDQYFPWRVSTHQLHIIIL